MRHFDFSITSYCNAACPSCKRYPDHGSAYVDPNQKLHPNLKQLHMDFDVFKKVIEDNIDQFKNKHGMYEGELGDCMVHPKVLSFIDYGTQIFTELKVVTNGGARNAKFYRNLAKYENLMMIFSIDGLEDDTNQVYRKNVNTKKAIDNMISFASERQKYKTKKMKKTLFNPSWQFLVFDHNFFEIPDVLKLAWDNNISVQIKINQRPKFKISDKRLQIAENLYEKYKTKSSKFVIAN